MDVICHCYCTDARPHGIYLSVKERNYVNDWFASLGCFLQCLFIVHLFRSTSVRPIMDSVLFFFLILFQGLVNCFVFAVEENATSSRSAYFMTRENKRLEGHVVKRLESASLMSCNHLCLRNSWCTSTNFEAPSNENGRGTCELNKHGAIDTDSEFYDQQGVTISMLQKVNSTELNRHSKLFGGRILRNFSEFLGKFSNKRYHLTAPYY